MATVEDGIAAQIRNIEASYGRPLSDWFAVIADSELTKHNDVVAMLKSVHGMAHGAAHRVSLQYRAAAEPRRRRSTQASTRSTPGRRQLSDRCTTSSWR